LAVSEFAAASGFAGASAVIPNCGNNLYAIGAAVVPTAADR